LMASLPVFNGFQREAAVIRAGAEERAAEARARDAVLAARVAVETAVRDIELAQRRVQVADRTVSLATEDLRVQEERYRIGAATILDLQASQVALAEAEAAGVRARQGLATAVAELETILGEDLGEE
ncbi:MAG TPA: TolC family protein, partial [Longimicrobiales bacterium]|nr:TolC family protein [Longimicrobiales bacterium]